MDIHNSVDGLKSLLGVNPAVPAATGATNNVTTGTPTLGADRATLSSAGSEVSLTAGDDAVHTDKVAAVQSALAAGTYNVPASAVATKVVDAMLTGNK